MPCNINKTHFALCSGELWTNVHFMILKCVYKYFILSFHTVSLCEGSPAMDWRPVWSISTPLAHGKLECAPSPVTPKYYMKKWVLEMK